jgi:hypothetical protein
MPTVLRVDGMRFVTYPNDHPPAHVHVIGPGRVVVVNLVDAEVREVIGGDERDARRVLRLISRHQEALMDARREFHG